MATFKIGALLIRTLAKPLANSLKTQAAQHPTFKRVCINIAQSYHRTEENLKMKFLGYKVETIRPLNEAKAVENGAAFLSELFIFGVRSIRSSLKSNQRNRQIDEDIISLQAAKAADEQSIAELKHKVETLEIESGALRSATNALLSVVVLKEAQQRAWLPGWHRGKIDEELKLVKRNLDTARNIEVDLADPNVVGHSLKEVPI
ncbi:OPA3-domain-containing protein [Rhizoclosmatium globosum]|uniref:OPA3-domain-containing protein n=1 Tax=Rhizoclosmatium globosum TaxID=329046 RepID=A0A1Y2D3G8_9FUNG|nr:OPA3-domain-containing protein [Rhizoclosmatium globosum]|eukprot:ORY53831.1 OPA3-domain-containing protein [Rhizoclosmatium globosum]